MTKRTRKKGLSKGWTAVIAGIVSYGLLTAYTPGIVATLAGLGMFLLLVGGPKKLLKSETWSAK